MGINTATLSGNVGQDPEVKYFEGGSVVAAFSLAVQGFANKEKVTHWFNCKAWGKVGELVGEYVKKGNSITVSGNLEVESWEKDGHKFSKTVLIVRDIQLPPKGE